MMQHGEMLHQMIIGKEVQACVPQARAWQYSVVDKGSGSSFKYRRPPGSTLPTFMMLLSQCNLSYVTCP